jgi:hypothetical protein
LADVPVDATARQCCTSSDPGEVTETGSVAACC